MLPMNRELNRPVRRWIYGALITMGLALGATACGDNASGPELSVAGGRGKSLSSSSGCAGCHGTEGQGGVGPTWQGLAGAEVELADGTMIVADDEYLIRAIKKPNADLRAGYPVQMPRNNLNDRQIADIVTYINDLAYVTPGG